MKHIHRLISLLVLLPLALIAVLLGILNRGPVEVDLLVGIVNLPLGLAVLVIFALGVVAGLVIAWVSAGKWRRRARWGERKAHALESEVAELQQRSDSGSRGRTAVARLTAGWRRARHDQAALHDS